MNFLEMRNEVFRRLNESSTSPTFWTETDVELALNEGYEELSDASEWYEDYAVITTQSNLTYYDLRKILPEEFLAIKRLYNQTTGEWLTPTTTRDLDYHTTRTWETVTGEPEKYLIRGLWWLGLFPRAATDDTKIKISYSAIPTRLTEDTDEPNIPQEFHKYLVEYALYDLLAQDGESVKSVKHWKEYIVGEMALREFVFARLRLDRVPNV